ncbi:MAG: hypothetical protein LLG04_07620 [Parachlamydia sp.]|nr:hypothetical protein [Parachlamydia sp.]
MSGPINNLGKPNTQSEKWDFTDYPRSQPKYKPYGNYEPSPNMSNPKVREAVNSVKKDQKRAAQQKKS